MIPAHWLVKVSVLFLCKKICVIKILLLSLCALIILFKVNHINIITT